MLLMYEKIYFLPNDTHLNPGHTSISKRFSINDSLLFSAFGTREDAYYSLMYASEKNIWDDRLKKLMEMYDQLEEDGRCVPLQDSTIENIHQWHPLEKAVETDMDDADFLSHCIRSLNKKLFVPPLPETATMKGGGFASRPPKYKRETGFAAVCSERLNTALYIAGKYNLVPLSNFNFYEGLLSLKFRRALTNPNLHEDFNVKDQSRLTRFGMLSWHILTEVVPEQLVQEKTVKQIAKYKRETGELQEKFRKYVERLELEIDEEPWGRNFPDKIKRIVDIEIVPAIEKLREEKKVIWEKLFNEAIKTTFSKKLLVPLLSMHLIPNLSYIDLLCYSTAGFLGGFLPGLIDLRQQEKEIRKNALFFLLNFK